MKKSLCIVCHLGMGDHLVMNGLVRHMARLYDFVAVPTKYHNLVSVHHMYRDTANICPRAVIDHDDQVFFAQQVWKGEALYLGMDKLDWPSLFPAMAFDRVFYHQAGLSFDLRWSGFDFPRAQREELPVPMIDQHKPYAFVHDDPERGFVIRPGLFSHITDKPEQVFRPSPAMSLNIFAYLPIIEQAAEIHCINSSFALLIDSLPHQPNQKLFLHAYARPGGDMPTYRRDWLMIKKPTL